jgi:hypothetical protein
MDIEAACCTDRAWCIALGPHCLTVSVSAGCSSLASPYVPQAKNVLDNIGDVCRVAVPMFLYFMIMWTATLIVTRKFHGTYEQCVTQVGSTQLCQSAWCV